MQKPVKRGLRRGPEREERVEQRRDGGVLHPNGEGQLTLAAPVLPAWGNRLLLDALRDRLAHALLGDARPSDEVPTCVPQVDQRVLVGAAIYSPG